MYTANPRTDSYLRSIPYRRLPGKLWDDLPSRIKSVIEADISYKETKVLIMTEYMDLSYT